MGDGQAVVRRRLVVHGAVQGVFFRDGCREQANEAGVAGSAANLADGSVEILLEGDEDSVQRVVEWARTGPSGASVERVDIEEQEPLGTTGFEIE